MKHIYKYFFRQSLNFWKSLSLRLRIEILILLFIYFVFFTGRLAQYSNEILNTSQSTSVGLTSFALHVFLILIFFSVPFIHLYLIPKQKSWNAFRVLPLNRENSFLLLLFYHLKYQIISFVLALPVFIAFLFSAGILYALYFAAGLILFLIMIIFLITFLSLQYKQPAITILIYFCFILLFNAIYGLIYSSTNFFIHFDFFILTSGFVLLTQWWKKNWKNWDLSFKAATDSQLSKNYATKNLTYFRLREYVPKSIFPFFAKEFLNYLRNRRYIKLQIITLLIFITAIAFFTFNLSEDYSFYSTILVLLIVWEHFSLQFNEKYVKADSRLFMKTLPFRYYQVWIAKFINEYLFILIMQMILIVGFVIRGLSITEILHIIFLINVFSTIVLITIINFKILFYDQPRFAGYAYHFFIIFTTVMSFNYRLVGPLITLVLIGYFTFSSYKEFAR